MSLLWICDVNGVLVDTTPLIREAFRGTARHFGLQLGDSDFQRVKGLWLLEAYRTLAPSQDPLVARSEHLRRMREKLPDVRAHPDVPDLLAEAKARKVRVAATTSHGEFAEACLVSTGLYGYLECLVTQEEVKRHKPHPDAIERVMELCNTRGDRACTSIYVGDTPADIAAGKAAGVTTIGVTYGVSCEAEIRAAAPDRVIRSFSEMRGFMSASAGRAPIRPATHMPSCLRARSTRSEPHCL